MKREIPRRGPNAQRHSAFLLSGGEGETSWHYTVDDHEIYHHIPDNEVAWHAGDKEKEDGGNLCGIGVELCVNEDGNFESTFENGARLTARLLQIHHLELSAVKQHGDFIEKNCPQTIRDNGRWAGIFGESVLLSGAGRRLKAPANAETMRGAGVPRTALLF